VSVSKTEGCRFDSYCPCHLTGFPGGSRKPAVQTAGLRVWERRQTVRLV